MYSSPQEHPRLTTARKQAMMVAAGASRKPVKNIPWRCILTDPAVIAIAMVLLAEEWTRTFLLAMLPLYFDRVYNLNVVENGISSVLPVLANCITAVLAGMLSDRLVNTHGHSRLFAMKVMTVLSSIPPAILIFAASYPPKEYYQLAVALVIGVDTFIAFSMAGVNVNPMYLSPRYSGVVFAIANTFANIIGGLNPLITGLVTNSNATQGQYRLIMAATSFILIATCVFYLIFAKSEVRAWDKES